MNAVATRPLTYTRTIPTDTNALVRTAIADLVAFWAELPVDAIGPSQARSELFSAVPSLRRLAEATRS